MKKLLLFLCFIFVLNSIHAQSMGFGSINWMPDGNSFTTIDKNSIVKMELPALTKTVLFDLEPFIPKDKANPRTISSYLLSKDMKQVLLKINTKTQYHKTTGEVWVYDSVTGKILQLGKTLNTNALM